jgi:C1A family cysteine protease
MKQPVAVAVDANNWGYYSSGIFSNCTSTTVNHAVVIVGYTPTYWII